eukprot:scaffold470_cov135-Isochrysis_galbana.AAC.2
MTNVVSHEQSYNTTGAAAGAQDVDPSAPSVLPPPRAYPRGRAARRDACDAASDPCGPATPPRPALG